MISATYLFIVGLVCYLAVGLLYALYWEMLRRMDDPKEGVEPWKLMVATIMWPCLFFWGLSLLISEFLGYWEVPIEASFDDSNLYGFPVDEDDDTCYRGCNYDDKA